MPAERKPALKTRWTWEEWKAGRAALRAVTDKVHPGSIRRKSSSSDRRLREAFAGERGPKPVQPS